MIRFSTFALTAALALAAAGGVSAAEKSCCMSNAKVASHVSCCEMGNKGFFKQSCGTHSCEMKTAKKATEPKAMDHKAHGKTASLYVKGCEVGNKGFFACKSCDANPLKADACGDKGDCCTAAKK